MLKAEHTSQRVSPMYFICSIQHKNNMEALKVTQKLHVKSHPIIDRSINIPMGKELFKDNIKDTTASSIDVVLVS